MTELSRRDRLQALARLEEISDEIGAISTWLSRLDEDKSAIVLEDAHRSIAAAAWALQTPLRHRPEGWLSRPRSAEG
jgi:hypothetical protein